MNTNPLIPRHIGPSTHEIKDMLEFLKTDSLDQLIDKCIPTSIRMKGQLNIGESLTESESLEKLRSYAMKNKVHRSYIGMGYSPCVVPTVIQRNILENPGWYTQYTPYQPEIAQGRLEALLNFQTMISDLTGLPIANASLLDEGTAAAEAMTMAKASNGKNKNSIFVSELCHPQTIEVIQTRALPLNIKVIVGDHKSFVPNEDIFAAVLSYPATDGNVFDYRDTILKLKQKNALTIMACDILSLALLTPPGELGADIAVGTTQRFGLGMFYGGPHAAYLATKEDFKRQIPGRIVGLTKDAQGKPATRLALQTREQHIRRDKASSNICTAQVLLAVVASMYAVYHGPDGIRQIALKTHKKTSWLKNKLKQKNFITTPQFFDGLTVHTPQAKDFYQLALTKKINLRLLAADKIYLQLDEATTMDDLQALLQVFDSSYKACPTEKEIDIEPVEISDDLLRESKYLSHPNFNRFHSETEFLRYATRLQKKDLSLNHSMIPLGSCTMKLNATSEMIPISWPEFANLHPFAPLDQTLGYQDMFKDLENWLGNITGFDAVSLQPNAGSQGEYAGLLVIRAYHESKGESHRNICLIPTSAHGTNPASAVMAGMKVVPVACDERGDIDLQDLKNKSEMHAKHLAALMITYPSTHGVFEEEVKQITDIIHHYGGQVYLDGANMNAQVGLCRPGDYGADVCHLNLHKTFSIPHGGGGPGMGPIGVKAHLKSFLPGSKQVAVSGDKTIGAISAAPWGSALILNISWMYIAMMGNSGLKRASEIAILNANYIAKKLEKFYPILFKAKTGFVAHECIIDTRVLKKLADIEVIDIAKRLMDYGYHSPTMSWPVIGTMMIEPTESESKEELDRFCDAMIGIYGEASAIHEGKLDKTNNPLKNAPHTADVVISDTWDRPYSRELAAFPTPWTRENKFWPQASRVDDAFGDRNLVCTCPSMDSYSS
ncbi:MAG: aminomethyl-transferring glycine dehydrogenase [Bdellovibrionales bacterium]|nr:aminomethyl-transferring glycine dehydrogenase [Bdellovibrionales bacterium]